MSELRTTSPCSFSLSIYLTSPFSRSLSDAYSRLVPDLKSYLSLKSNNLIAVKVRDRQRRPSEGSRTLTSLDVSYTDIGAESARSSHLPGLEPHSAADDVRVQEIAHACGLANMTVLAARPG